MKRVLIILLMLISMASAQNQFTKIFNVVTVCMYDAGTNKYTANCKTVEAVNKFVINYHNTTNVLWITNYGDPITLINLGKESSTYNDDGDLVEVFNFMDEEGNQYLVAWAIGKWFKIVVPTETMCQFSTKFD